MIVCERAVKITRGACQKSDSTWSVSVNLSSIRITWEGVVKSQIVGISCWTVNSASLVVGWQFWRLLVPGPSFETHCSKPKHWAQGFIFKSSTCCWGAALFLNHWNKIKQWNYGWVEVRFHKLEIALLDLRKYKWILTGENGFGSYSLLPLVFSVTHI